MDQVCLVLPVREGKSATARDFMRELETDRKAEYAVSERRIGIDKEAWYLASLPSGDQLVAYMESPDFNPFGETEWGPAWGTLTATFTGRMGGKQGTATMFFTIREAVDTRVMTGTWVILSGTKALKHVTGSGTWVSSGFDSSADYAGTRHWK